MLVEKLFKIIAIIGGLFAVFIVIYNAMLFAFIGPQFSGMFFTGTSSAGIYPTSALIVIFASGVPVEYFIRNVRNKEEYEKFYKKASKINPIFIIILSMTLIAAAYGHKTYVWYILCVNYVLIILISIIECLKIYLTIKFYNVIFSTGILFLVSAVVMVPFSAAALDYVSVRFERTWWVYDIYLKDGQKLKGVSVFRMGKDGALVSLKDGITFIKSSDISTITSRRR